jgi:hypothetical protein
MNETDPWEPIVNETEHFLVDHLAAILKLADAEFIREIYRPVREVESEIVTDLLCAEHEDAWF